MQVKRHQGNGRIDVSLTPAEKKLFKQDSYAFIGNLLERYHGSTVIYIDGKKEWEIEEA